MALTGNCFPQSRENRWLNLLRMEFSEGTKSPADGIFGRDKTIECLELPQEQTSASAALMSPNDPEADLTIRRILTIKVSQSLQSSAAEIGKV